jgi:hypothetical protein
MQGRSTLFVLGVVLAAVGCIGHGGGSSGGGGISPIAGSNHIVVSVQPASPQVDQPIAIQVQVLNAQNQPAAVTTNASVSISATPLGLSPRTLAGTIPAGVTSSTFTGHIATAGAFTLSVSVNTNSPAGTLTGKANVTVVENTLAGSTSGEVQVDSGGPGIASYQNLATAALDSQVAVAFADQRLQGASHVFVNSSPDGGNTFLGPVQADRAPQAADAWDAAVSIDGQGTAAVAWCDQRASETGQVFANVSRDGGQTYGAADVRVDAATVRVAPCSGTRVALANGRLVVAWMDTRDAKVGGSIYIARSLNGGQTFSETRLDTHTAGATPWSDSGLSLVGSGDDVTVLWVESQGSTTNVVAASSQDGGATFKASTLNTVTTAHVRDPKLAASGGVLYAAWRDDRTSVATTPFLCHSLDGGATWSAEAPVPTGAAKAQISSLSLGASGLEIVVLLASQDQGATEVVPFAVVSTDGGATFNPIGALPQGTQDSVRDPEVAASGRNVYSSWNEVTYASGERASLSTNNGTTFATASKVSASAAADGLFGPSRSVFKTGGRFFVLWEESRGTPTSASHLYLVVLQ